MLRVDPQASVAALRVATEVSEKDDADAAIRWMPVFVPLSGAAVLFTALLIWTAVL